MLIVERKFTSKLNFDFCLCVSWFHSLLLPKRTGVFSSDLFLVKCFGLERYGYFKMISRILFYSILEVNKVPH